MYGLLSIARTNYDTNSVSLNLQRQARQGMGWLSREIRQAYLDTIIPGPPDVSGIYHSITFDRFGVNGVTYSLVSGQLKRSCSTCTEMPIANDIIGLNFSPIVGNKQKITLEASKTFRSLGKDRTLTFSLTQQVQVRNP